MTTHEEPTPQSMDDPNGKDTDQADVIDPDGPCLSCGSPNARIWQTPDGPARLCPPCATLNGLGCP